MILSERFLAMPFTSVDLAYKFGGKHVVDWIAKTRILLEIIYRITQFPGHLLKICSNRTVCQIFAFQISFLPFP